MNNIKKSNYDIKKVNPKIVKYIEEKIFPKYELNDKGHQLDHIEYVINRSFKFANTIPNINYDIVFVIAAYHDLGHHIDPKNHEIVSSNMFLEDLILKDFFSEDEIKIISEAIIDHRSTLEYEPRSIYGKIVSSADRNTIIDVPLMRTYEYRIKHNKNSSLKEIIEESRQHLIEKFGENGYANKKIYFPDEEYDTFLKEIALLTKNKDEFIKRYCEINKISLN